jgi:hypothetical protein
MLPACRVAYRLEYFEFGEFATDEIGMFVATRRFFLPSLQSAIFSAEVYIRSKVTSIYLEIPIWAQQNLDAESDATYLLEDPRDPKISVPRSQ